MIGFEEVSKEREKKIAQIKKDIAVCKIARDTIDAAHCTLKIKYERMEETNTSLNFNYEDVVDKLHLMSKARYELETKLTDKHEECKSIIEIMAINKETLLRRQSEVEELEKQVTVLQRDYDGAEIKRLGIEKGFEITKKQQSEKIANLTDIISSEKETRDGWIKRYETEQQKHTETQSELIKAKSDLTDQVLAVRNEEIKMGTANRQI